MQSGSQRGRVKRLPPAAQQLGKNDAHVAQTLHNLALLYRNSGQLDKAAAPYERSRGIWRAKEAWGLLAVSFKDSAVLCDLQVVKPPRPSSRTNRIRLATSRRAAHKPYSLRRARGTVQGADGRVVTAGGGTGRGGPRRVSGCWSARSTRSRISPPRSTRRSLCRSSAPRAPPDSRFTRCMPCLGVPIVCTPCVSTAGCVSLSHFTRPLLAASHFHTLHDRAAGLRAPGARGGLLRLGRGGRLGSRSCGSGCRARRRGGRLGRPWARGRRVVAAKRACEVWCVQAVRLHWSNLLNCVKRFV